MLGAVGRLVESKGFEMLIEAFAKASARQPDLQLAIIGEGPLRAVLQARIDALGLAGRVHLSGHRDDLQQLYRAFDWLLVPSRSEGLGAGGAGGGHGRRAGGVQRPAGVP